MPRAIAGYRQPPPPDMVAGLVRRSPPAPVWGTRRTSRSPGASSPGSYSRMSAPVGSGLVADLNGDQWWWGDDKVGPTRSG
jgi:hypothetical protein